MSLGEIVLQNEKQGEAGKNSKLVRLKLAELIATYPSEVTQVLQKTDVPLSKGLPSKVIYAVVVKHLGKNSTLRDAIAKMLLEMDGYHNAVGWVTIVGSALTAVSSVLNGISRGQNGQNGDVTQAELERQRLEMERQRAEEAARRRRNGWLIVGGLVVSAALVILIIRMVRGNNQAQAEIAKQV